MCANAPWAFADSLPRRGRPAAWALEKTVSQTGWPHHPERKRPGGSPAPEAVRPRSQNRGNWGPASLTHPGTPHWQEIPFSSGLLKSGLIQDTFLCLAVGKLSFRCLFDYKSGACWRQFRQHFSYRAVLTSLLIT